MSVEAEKAEKKEEKKEPKRVFDEYRALSDESLQPEKSKEKEFLEAMGSFLEEDNNQTFLKPYLHNLDLCVKCGTCAETCPVYLASGRKEIYNPVYRSEMLRKIYKRYFTTTGKIFRGLAGAKEVNNEDLNALAEASWRCSICRRCAVACPVALDNGLMTREIRKIFDAIGIAPDELREEGTWNQVKYGNATKTPTEAFKDMVEFIQEDIEDEKGISVDIPLDKKNADYLVMNNAGDYIAFMETIMGIVEIMDAAGVDWTLNTPDSGVNDVVNYGLFYSDKEFLDVANAHVETLKELNPKNVVIGECGHAYDSYVFYNKVFPDIPFNLTTIVDVVDDFIQSGKIKVDPNKNPEPVTFHDSCKWGRAAGYYEKPRRILESVCKDFREMYPNRELNHCCGGGSGFAIMDKDNFYDFRMETYGKIKAEQVRNANAKVVATACANCKGQWREIINYHKLNEEGVRFSGLSELVANAIVYD